MDEADRRFEGLQDKLNAIAKEGLSGRSTEPPSTTGAGELVRGWARDTRRATIIKDAKDAISQVGAADLCDGDPWVSGARRSNAFLNFQARGQEVGHQVRERMQKLIAKFAEVQPEVRGVRVTVTWSKPPEERQRGAHCNFTKKLIANLAVESLEQLDLERQTGTAWLGESKVASAVERLDGNRDGFFVFEDSPGSRLTRLPRSFEWGRRRFGTWFAGSSMRNRCKGSKWGPGTWPGWTWPTFPRRGGIWTLKDGQRSARFRRFPD